MKSILTNNSLKFFLIAFALIVWGNNGYKIFKGIQNSDELKGLELPMAARSVLSDDGAISKNNWTYKQHTRDPFQNLLAGFQKHKQPITMKRKNAVRQAKKPALQLPSLRLVGIIRDPIGAIAIIEDSQQSVFFVSKSDSVAGVQIVSIDSIRVNCKYEQHSFALTLQ